MASPPSPPPFKIAICGGGLGGLATLLSFLHSLPPTFSFFLYEKDDNLTSRTTGYGLTLTYNPKGPLAKLGVLELVAVMDCPSRSHYLFAADGSIRGYFGNAFNADTSPRGQRGNMRVPRATLRKILHDEICSHERFEPAMINWGKELTMYTQDPDTNLLSLTFKDGSVEDKVSLLIGADGVRSCVALLTPKPAPSSYFGIMLVLGISSFQHPLTTERGFYSIDGNSRLFLMPFEAAKTMWQLTFNFDYEKAMELRKAGPQALLDHINAAVAHFHDPVPALVAATPVSTVWGAPLLDRNPFPLNSKENKNGRVVLLGDACHAMSPFKGQGCNQALSDGPLLASKLKNTPRNVPSALLAFEREMIARTKVKVEESRKAAKLLHDPSILEEAEGFSGVRPETESQLIAVLKERGIGASLGGELDDAVRSVIVELGFLAEETDKKRSVSEAERLAMLECCRRGDLGSVRERSFENPASLLVRDDEGKNLVAVAGEHDVLRVWLRDEMKIEVEEGGGKVKIGVFLNDDEWQWLERAVLYHQLPDEGKAYRCCVNFLAQTEGRVMEEAGVEGARRREVSLAPSQLEWMNSTRSHLPIASFGGAVVRRCMTHIPPADIFGVIRCKTQTGLATADTPCAGAQEALQRQKSYCGCPK